MHRFTTSIIVAVTFAAIALPASACAISREGAVAALNAQRVANGIPGGVTLNAGWSDNCAAHNRYMQASGVLAHDEVPGRTGYSVGGAWAGPNSVLSFNSAALFSWTTNPWENAPFHLAQVLQPGLRAVGYDNSGAYACMTTWPGADNAGLAGQVFTYPGDGRTGVPPSQAARELPSTPQQALGIAATATTGPNLFVYAYGLGGSSVRVTSASLSPSIPVKWVDNTTPVVGGRIPSGAILVPTAPLEPNTKYTATVHLAGASSTTVHAWTFQTGASNSKLADTRIRLTVSFARLSGHRVKFTGAANGGKVKLTVQLKKPHSKKLVKLATPAASGTYTGTVKYPKAGQAVVCASLGKLKLCGSLKV